MTLFYMGLFFLAYPAAAQSKNQPHTLKITTWNLEWFTDKNTGDRLLPLGVEAKSPAAVHALIHILHHIHSEIIAFQEADNTPLLTQLFPSDIYALYISAEPYALVQHTGLAISKNIQTLRHDDLDLQPGPPDETHHPVRNGADVTIFWHDKPIRILAVHLKSGCWDAPLTLKTHSCPILRFQLEKLHNWIKQRHIAQEDFIILGDFNRRLVLSDESFQQLARSGPLILATAGKASPCENGRYFIDHILLSSSLAPFYNPNALRVALYPSKDLSEGGKTPPPPSDHCPVSLTLEAP